MSDDCLCTVHSQHRQNVSQWSSASLFRRRRTMLTGRMSNSSSHPSLTSSTSAVKTTKQKSESPPTEVCQLVIHIAYCACSHSTSAEHESMLLARELSELNYLQLINSQWICDREIPNKFAELFSKIAFLKLALLNLLLQHEKVLLVDCSLCRIWKTLCSQRQVFSISQDKF